MTVVEREAIETVGTSPKAVYASLAALLTPACVKLLGNLFDVEIDDETVEALVLAGVSAVGGFVGARLARPGKVKVDA